MHRLGYYHGGGWGCPCMDAMPWGRFGPYAITRDEMVEEMEEYKARLESEIAALEKRISSLKEKQ